MVSGMVLDAETLEPLPNAHLLRNHLTGTSPDQSGIFKVRLQAWDTLTVSHVSYLAQNLVINPPQNADTVTLTIFLERETTVLQELLVRPYPNLETFKQQVLEIEVEDPVQHLRDQQAAITYDIIMSPKVSYDSYENYRRINHPTDITLFSTGPSKGIGRVLRSLGIGKKYRK